MAALILQVLLAVMALAFGAVGLVNQQFALFWWFLAAVLLCALIAAWAWERHRNSAVPTAPVKGPKASTSGSYSPAVAISGDHNRVSIAPLRATSPRLTEIIDHRLVEGDALRERLGERVTTQHVHDLLRDIQAWQRRCARTVRHCTGGEAAFKSKAGPFQPLFAEDGWNGRTGDWRVNVEARLERWMAALRDLLG